MRLENEQDLLNIDFRKAVIEEIVGDENVQRKLDSKKKYDILKDKTKGYVVEQLRQESSDEILHEMLHRASNISIGRKIIDKKSMVYKHGAEREVEGENKKDQEKLDSIIDLTNFQSKMKQVNKYVEAFKIAGVYAFPYKDKDTGTWKIHLNILPPHQYDVIEDSQNQEIPRVVIFSYYDGSYNSQYKDVNESGNREAPTLASKRGDGINQTIADEPEDSNDDKMKYVWWSSNFHFTTDSSGKITSEETDNNIGELPFEFIAKNQDGHFWPVGGEDIADGSILINLLLTDMYYIAKFQGMGIGYLFGKGVPKHLRVGPSSFLTLDVNEGDPKPEIGFASSNPPLNDHMAMVEQYLRLLLSTNNLEAGSADGSLTVGNAGSGISEIIRMSENLDDIKDQHELYRDAEPNIIRKILKWYKWLFDKTELDKKWKEIGVLDPEIEIDIEFKHPEPIMTEMQKLEVIEKKLDIGIIDMVKALMEENEGMTEQDAKKELLRMTGEKIEQQRAVIKGMDNGIESDIQNEPTNQVEGN